MLIVEDVECVSRLWVTVFDVVYVPLIAKCEDEAGLPPPPTLHYVAAADSLPTNAQATHLYKHITCYVTAYKMNSTLHLTFSLCCRLTPHLVLYSLFS